MKVTDNWNVATEIKVGNNLSFGELRGNDLSLILQSLPFCL